MPKDSLSLLNTLESNAEEVMHTHIETAARTMAHLSHPQRLRVLCLLVEKDELSVAQLLEHIPLSPSALSQHLTKMRENGLIKARRSEKNVFYTIHRKEIRDILDLLHRLYCSFDK